MPSTDNVPGDTPVPWQRFIERHPELFPSGPSLRWYIHKNRPALQQAGALAIHRKRLYVKPSAFLATMWAIAESKTQADPHRCAA